MAVSVIQEVFNSTTGTAESFVVVTLTGVGVGHAIHLEAVISTSAGSTGVTASDGVNNYVPIGNITDATASRIVWHWYANNVSGGTLAIKVQLTGGTTNQFFVVGSEIGGTIGYDASATIPTSGGQYQAGVGTGANAITTGNFTPGTNPGLMHGFTFTINQPTSIAAGTTSGFSLGINGTGDALGAAIGGGYACESFRYTANTALAATFTQTGGGTTDVLSVAALFVEGTPAVSMVVDQSPFGPGISPDYRTMFTARRLSTALAPLVYTSITGRAHFASFAAGNALGIGVMTGRAAMEAQAVGGPLAGTGNLSGVASCESQALGRLLGTATIQGVANFEGFAFATLNAQGSGMLFGRGYFESTARATLLGAGILRGVAHSETQALGKLSGTGMLAGLSLAAVHTGPALLLGTGALGGRAHMASFVSAQSSAFADIVGRASFQAFALGGPLTGSGALSGRAHFELASRGLLLYVGAGVMSGRAYFEMNSLGDAIGGIARFGYAQVVLTGSNITGQQVSVSVGGPYPQGVSISD